MRRKATRKDFYMEIRKSSGRFLSILFIVTLGVAFFSGIRASEPSMRITGDAYFDGEDLMDIKALSTFGITERDIQAIAEIEGVANVEGAYSKDFLNETGEEQHVLHVMSLPKEMNQITVSKGRLPEKTGECLMDADIGYQAGDTVVLKSGTEDSVSDTLKTAEYKVVGIGSSPCYISFGRGSAVIGNGSISGFMMVPGDDFDLDVYTESYVQVSGAKELVAYTEEYKDKVGDVLDHIESITGERAQIRRQEIVDEAQEELDDAKQELSDAKAEIKEELGDAKKKLDDGQAELENARNRVADGKKQIKSAKAALKSKQKELERAKKEYQEGLEKWKDGKTEYSAGQKKFEKTEASAQKSIKQGEAGLKTYRQQLDVKQKDYQTLLGSIAAMEANPPKEPSAEWDVTLAAMKKQEKEAKKALSAAEADYNKKNVELQKSKEQLEAGEQRLKKSKALLDNNKKKLDKAAAQIKSGQSQIDSGRSEIDRQEQKLKEGEAEITENEIKLKDAQKEYEDGKKEAEQEIADAEEEIKEAEQDIAKIELPKWYVYDRSTLPEYEGYGENADRMRAIGRVFPVIFFLVAALISLTSMTRMVEEQRIQIGTMKALGYSKASIIFKYLGYALLATAGGSIIGVLVGEKVLPYIIIYAYGILYQHIPEILVPYSWSYAIQASLAAVACTMFATLFSCVRELSEQPASLMRPPSPKIGKRVLLEYVPFLWKRLNFTWKSTIRNLMRYKKRFFMTIFGIGGCMALMLVGYGIKDSVFEIADIQYDEIQIYDGSIILKEELTVEERENLDVYLQQNQDVDRHMDSYMKNITLKNGEKENETYIMVLGSPKESEKYVDFHDRKTKEEYRLSDEGAIVSEKTAKLLNVGIGDSVYVKDEETGDKEIRIEHICENYMGHYIYLTPKYYEKVYSEKPKYNNVMFAMKDSYEKERLEKAGEDILARDEVLSVSYMHDIEKQLNDMLKSLNLVIIVLIISAGMLAFVVLYNLNSINITERIRELATLKVLGFYNPEVAAYVYRENILLTFIGAAVGVVFGRILHLFIIETVEVPGAMFGRNINFPSYIYSLLFTVAFSMIVNGVMYFKLKKINMVESLKSIE
ncbi:MAG: FtsX-like permease family protein [Lachnospiraceae bacterium]|nr:FtsX-like permease family protein [Lachnospiraceae bacterium]